MATNWPHCALNQVARSTSVKNSAFLLAIIATPIDCAHYLICSSLLLMRTIIGLLIVGKGRRPKLHDAAAQIGKVRAGYVLLEL